MPELQLAVVESSEIFLEEMLTDLTDGERCTSWFCLVLLPIVMEWLQSKPGSKAKMKQLQEHSL